MVQPSLTGNIDGIPQQTARRIPPPYDHCGPLRYPSSSIGLSSVPIASEIKGLVRPSTIAKSSPAPVYFFHVDPYSEERAALHLLYVLYACVFWRGEAGLLEF